MPRERMTAGFDKQLAQKIKELALKKGMSESRLIEEAVALGLIKLETLPTTNGRNMGKRLTTAVINEINNSTDTKSKGEQLAAAYGKIVLKDTKGWTPLD